MWSTIAITVLVLGGLNGILALLLVIAERFLVDYGECTLTVNGQKEYRVQGGSTLLNTLKNEKIYLPSACGGRGTCAYCKCRVVEGGGTLLPTEAPLLSSHEIETGMRLACQVKVKRDMVLQIPEELLAIREYRARVGRIETLTHDIKWLRCELLDPTEIHFIPGQYVQLQNNPYSDVRESVSRAYSIASPNTQTRFIDLIVRLVPDGIVTTWVHQVLKEGEEIMFTGPMGEFRLQDGEGEILMVAGGSGMAPMVSILNQMKDEKIERKTHYFFGAVEKRDLFYLDEMKEFEKSLKQFSFIPALSKPLPQDEWQGETGLITHPLESYLGKSDHSSTQAYLCGSPGMIKACSQVLRSHGIADDRIFFDPFS